MTETMNRAERRKAEREARKEFAQRKRAAATKTAAKQSSPDDAAAAAAAAAMAAGGPLPPGGLPAGIAEQAQRMAEEMAGEAAGGNSSASSAKSSSASSSAKRTGGAVARTEDKRPAKFVNLEKQLAGVLSSPAAVAIPAGDMFCANHFLESGPQYASVLVAYAESNATAYKWLLWLCEKGGAALVIVGTVNFLLPPLIHHGLPVPDGVRERYGVPNGSQPHTSHDPAAGAAHTGH